MSAEKERLLNEKTHDFDSLRLLTSVLRGEDGCMWDREQTHKTIRNDIIEETYEVVEAIDKDDTALLREELGDVLFQIIFHCQMETEAGNFTVDDVINDICNKMIYRHPHVFGDVDINNSAQILDNWEQLKKKEKSRATVREAMQSVPKELPTLMRARKIIKKAKKDGYAFPKDTELTDDISHLAGSLCSVSDDAERGALINLMLFKLLVLAGGEFDSEKNLSETVDAFIEKYPAGDVGEKNET